MVWIGPRKLRSVAAPIAAMSPARSRPAISSKMRMASCRPCHSASERSRYFSVTISRIGPTSCAMPPCTSTRLSCNCCACGRRHVVAAEDRVVGQQPPAADAELRIVGAGLHALDQLHPRPDAARVLPAAARAAQPLAQDGARGHDAPLLLAELAGERVRLARGAHADGDQRGQQVGRDRQPRSLGNAVDLADQLDAVARPDQPRQQVGQRLPGAFDARRHDARRR